MQCCKLGGGGSLPPCSIDSCDKFPFCLLRGALSNERSQQGDHFIILDRSKSKGQHLLSKKKWESSIVVSGETYY